MDDSCAVCADALEWVAYGSCGHREVCSTCVVRLRFVMDDKRCCICKSDCPTVFVTKVQLFLFLICYLCCLIYINTWNFPFCENKSGNCAQTF
jgi:Zinc finger, C3HC4 type (RING finger)